MVSSAKRTSAIQIIAILTTKPKRPSVKILKGSVITFNSGLRRKLIIPITAPTKSKDWIPPVISTPGTNLSANHKVAAPEIIWNTNFIITDI